MPEFGCRATVTEAKTVTLPPVWGDGVTGQIGETHYALTREGVVVSRVYRASRTATVVDAAGGRRTVRVAGLGGLFTPKRFRWRGYAPELDRRFLASAAADGFDLAMLFSLAPLVRYYARLGWTMSDTRPVTYRQPKGRLARCPSHIWHGLQPLSGSVDVTQIRAIDLEGYPW